MNWKCKRWKKMGTGLVLILCLMAVRSIGLGAYSYSEQWNDASDQQEWKEWNENWNTFSSNYEYVSLTPGKTETELNFAWYSHKCEIPAVRVSEHKDMLRAMEYPGTQQELSGDLEGYYSNKVTVTNLKAKKTYYYVIYQNGAWSDTPVKFKTSSFDTYNVLCVSDPQIGASVFPSSLAGREVTEEGDNSAAENDAFNWKKTMEQAVQQHTFSFVMSAGDQVNTSDNERAYAGFLGNPYLVGMPIATTIGNHDSNAPQYTYHFNNPNAAEWDSEFALDHSAAGTDYYYTYGNVLYIVLDTNNKNVTTHDKVMKEAVTQHSDKKWRIVTFHHDIYGAGAHSDTDGMELRTQLTPLMTKYNVDLVFQGHDHSYCRSYPLYANENMKDNEDYKLDKAEKGIKNTKGTVYIVCNSATGSLYYKENPNQQRYVQECQQNYEPGYMILTVKKDQLRVKAYNAVTGKPLDNITECIIEKEDNHGLKLPVVIMALAALAVIFIMRWLYKKRKQSKTS